MRQAVLTVTEIGDDTAFTFYPGDFNDKEFAEALLGAADMIVARSDGQDCETSINNSPDDEDPLKVRAEKFIALIKEISGV